MSQHLVILLILNCFPRDIDSYICFFLLDLIQLEIASMITGHDLPQTSAQAKKDFFPFSAKDFDS